MKIAAFLIVLFSMISAFASEQTCNMTTAHATYLAGAYIGHQSTVNEDFLQGEKPTGIFRADLAGALKAPVVQELGNCQFLILQFTTRLCAWEVKIDGNKKEVVEESSSYSCEYID